jgi:hypothetical protein
MEEPKKKHPDRPESRALDPQAVRCVEAASVFAQVSKKNRRRRAWLLLPAIALVCVVLTAGAIVYYNSHRAGRPAEEPATRETQENASVRHGGDEHKTPADSAKQSAKREPAEGAPTTAEPLAKEPLKSEPLNAGKQKPDTSGSAAVDSSPKKIDLPSSTKAQTGQPKADNARAALPFSRPLADLIDPPGKDETNLPEEWKN